MLHRGRLALVLILALSLILLDGSLVGLAQAPQLYPGTWRSGIGIKNLGGDGNAVTVLFYDAGTGSLQTYQYTTTLNAGAGVELYLPSIADTDLASGSYSVEVQSVEPVGVMATNTDYDVNIADSYNGVESATEFFVPGFYNNHNGWTSELLVQNTNDSAINVSIEVSGANLSTHAAVGPFTFGPLNIPAHATRSFDTGDNVAFDFDGQLGSTFLGAAKVTNTEGLPMAVVLFDTRVVDPVQVVLSYRGMTTVQDADTFLVAPILYKNFNNGWRSGITVQNVDTSNAVDVMLTVKSQDGSLTATNTQTLQPGKSYEWFLPSTVFDGSVSLPDQFIGAATAEVVSGAGEIVGTVVTTNYNRPKTLATYPPGQGVALGYLMPSRASGKTTLSAPTVYKRFGTGVWNSSLIVSNVGTNPVDLELTLASDADSVTYNNTVSGFTLSPGESQEFYLPLFDDGGSGIPDGFKGSILVTATGTTPMVTGLVQHTNYGRGVATAYLAPGN